MTIRKVYSDDKGFFFKQNGLKFRFPNDEVFKDGDHVTVIETSVGHGSGLGTYLDSKGREVIAWASF